MKFEIKGGTVTVENAFIFKEVNLTVSPGEIVSILGPSGCGKTTLLRACCGLTPLSSGERWLGDSKLAQGVHPDITMLFQQPVLYPHLNVAQNIALGLSKTEGKKERLQRIDAVLKSIGLEGFQNRGVANLSGGEAQRVAFGRALTQAPKVMLLDEPFASVDVARRLKLAEMTRQHLKERNITVLHVTHDEDEAHIMADRILRWTDVQPAQGNGERT
jgi:ABC-type nitrate/sulfonate/bicarbonate transport system ATPase subunit